MTGGYRGTRKIQRQFSKQTGTLQLAQSTESQFHYLHCCETVAVKAFFCCMYYSKLMLLLGDVVVRLI